ncbi:hypothetical protein AX17_002969 [Amanita inopinata Kibby_2008]|nr:hypothetical protein AX17_002969 [Amanita inopinata Kibby_2008]
MTSSTAEASASKAKIPTGWTDKNPSAATVEKMLRVMTNLPNVQLRLSQIKGSMYVFQSGTKYYLWNDVTESGSEVTDPTDYNKLLEQIGKDLRKVRVKLLPEPPGLEG